VKVVVLIAEVIVWLSFRCVIANAVVGRDVGVL